MCPKITLSGECSIDPTYVQLDGVFCGEDDTETVYFESCSPLVHFAVEGATTCVLCYGQTGSGKTFTTSGIFSYVTQDLAPFFATHDIHLSVIEIQAGKNVDLLTGNEVQVVEDVTGELKLQGCDPFECTSQEFLLAAFQEAASQRVTKSTGRNETSSRSHMIARISIVSKESRWAKPGDFFIVDLAGSENTADSSTHDKSRQVETKFINTSLMTLKDCIRSRAMAATSKQHLHIPYRRSPLTLLLRDCFEIAVKRPTKTVMIACLSPLLRDSRHTINTLRYASLLAVTPPAKVVAQDPNDPNNFDREQALDFLFEISKGQISEPELILPEGDGRTLVHIPEGEFIRRLLETHPNIGEKKAKMIYTAVWKRVVDARTKGRKVMTNAKKISKGPRCAN
ncbi:kinesin family member 2/24 [Angomonas deanei]|uniref:Kinesin motor domain/Microtubule binding, putative n=1 Tax=Angomonas deanei TaxID=59799 RepID=A0A7G2CAG5_9TRYP|nr:kinesin family member 2/24 [Angomonas deanei]CAD2216549.1 Kinesin motor domain/Microtubule binding, putative [Angomonas deanei]|eukprot:EPY39847.1 kinesin family member 2/24 [Angomonas deanei]